MPRGTIVVGTGTVGTKIIEKDWPHEEGLSGGFQVTGVDPNLEETC